MSDANKLLERADLIAVLYGAGDVHAYKAANLGALKALMDSDNEITRLTALVAKYEAAIDEHKIAISDDNRNLGIGASSIDLKLWQTLRRNK